MYKHQTTIQPKRGLLEIELKSIWHYRSLVRMLVYRDFVTYYKQTVLGPLWFFLQPVFAALVNLFVFGSLAGVGPEGVPSFLFYMSGPIVWQYFQDTLTKTSSTFVDNQHVFGKVYFPRLIVPLAIVLSGLLKLSVQFLLLTLGVIYYYINEGYLGVNEHIIFLPFILLMVMLLSLGFGLIISALTTKYRDLRFLVEFSVPLLRYVTPGIATTMVIYYNELPEVLWPIITYNPLGYLIDAFNYVVIGSGALDPVDMVFVFLFALATLFVGVILFNQTEKNFMDTV